ncbi:hypothetical protein M9Y10_040421 [Tritrichomonas musculus]|uniref:Uncharacterized protein n=1 Tax=Tritrichomonas musculus TaxID=1915356 RepID=A0ABR2GPK0_9EUKA
MSGSNEKWLEMESRASIESFPSKLDKLVVLTPEEWADAFSYIDKRVTFLLSNSDTNLIFEISSLAIRMTYPPTFESLCNYCLGPQIDESSRHTLSNFLILLSRVAIELDEEYSDSLSSDLISISKNLSLMKRNCNLDNHPLKILSHRLDEFLQSYAD